MKKILLSFFMLLLSTQMVYALSAGDYYSTSQQGMMVYLDSGGYYELQINNKPYQTGNFAINGNTLTFTPNWAAQGSLSQTNASITGNCEFNWGQSGTFQNNNCGSNNNTGGNTGVQYATLDSNFNLYIPQLNIDGTYYSVTMALITSGQDYYFKVTGVNQITPFYNNNYTATFYSDGTLDIPVVEVQGYYYNATLWLSATAPDILFTIYDVYELSSGSSSNYNSGGSNSNAGSNYYQSGYDPNALQGGYDSYGNYGYNTDSGMYDYD